MADIIIGRKKELEVLEKLYNSKKSEFVMVYGRRRVGKTYLISRKFEDQFTFRMTALANAKTKNQLQNFHNYLSLFDPDAHTTAIPKNWLEAFQVLEHVGELIFRAKIVNFSIRLGAKTGVMPSHNEDFRNDV